NHRSPSTPSRLLPLRRPIGMAEPTAMSPRSHSRNSVLRIGIRLGGNENRSETGSCLDPNCEEKNFAPNDHCLCVLQVLPDAKGSARWPHLRIFPLRTP